MVSALNITVQPLNLSVNQINVLEQALLREAVEVGIPLMTLLYLLGKAGCLRLPDFKKRRAVVLVAWKATAAVEPVVSHDSPFHYTKEVPVRHPYA